VRLRALAPYVALAAVLAAVWPVLSPPGPILGDHFVFWAVGRMVLEGRSPYDLAAWADLSARYPDPVVDGVAMNVIPDLYGTVTIWPYPPWTALVFVPFGALPIGLGTSALHFAYVLAGVAASVILARLLPWRSRASYAMALAISAAFQPFVMGTRGGQFGAFILLGLALAARGLVGGASARTVGSLLCSIKPHLLGAFAPVFVVGLARSRGMRALVIPAAALIAIASATLLRYPEALSTIVEGAGERVATADLFATTWAVSKAVTGEVDQLVVAGLIGTALLASIAAIRLAHTELRAPLALACSLALSLVVSPHVESYDDIVLLPAAFVALHAAERAARPVRPALAGATIVMAMVIPWLAILAQMLSGTQAASGALPFVFIALLVAAALARPQVA
jgi:hypothetical protein